MSFRSGLLLIAAALPLAALLVSAALPRPVLAEASPSSADVQWGEAQRIFQPKSGGAYYPRPLRLDDGSILVAFDTDEGSYGVTKVKVLRSDDEGGTWSAPVLVMEQTNVTCATPQLFQAKDGTVWCSFRMSWKEGTTWHTQICVKTSDDRGETWNELENGFLVDEAEVPGRYGGLWEPHIGYVGETVAMMYCDDSPRIGTSGSYQYILIRTWQGDGWSASKVVSGYDLSRDGMPVWIRLQDGRYLVVFEATDVQPSVFGIKYKLSPDGLDWSGERLEVDTPAVGRVENAPYVVQLSDGRILCAFQSDTDNAVRLGVNGSSVYAIEGQLDGPAIRWGSRYRLFPVPDAQWSAMGSLLPLDGNRVLAFCTTTSPSVGIFMKVGKYGGVAPTRPPATGTPAERPTGTPPPPPKGTPTSAPDGRSAASPWLLPLALGLLAILGSAAAGWAVRKRRT